MPDSQKNVEKPKRLVPLAPLFALLTLALGFAGLLIPRQSELVNRLVEDGRHDRALALVGESVNPDGSPMEAATAANLVQIFLDSVDHHFDQSAKVRIDALVRITDDPEGVRKVLLDRRRLLPKGLLPRLLDRLAVRAVHVNDPALAVSIYKDIEAIQPLTLEQTTQQVAACRYAGKPREALESVSHYLKNNHLPFTKLPEELRMTTITLHREVNEGAEAFDLLSEEFKATLDPEQRHELVELISTVAAQSGRVGDSLPILQEYLAKTDAGTKGWRELLNSKRKPHASDDDFRRFGQLQAQNFEWNGRTSDAFDIYRKLAAMGDLASLDRCVTVYPWVDREQDLTDLLETVVPVAEREPYTLLFARLQAQRGKFEEAESIYLESLAGLHAEDAAVWAEFGTILDAQKRFEEALTANQKALEIDPALHSARIRIARLYVTLGDYQNALLAYRGMPDEAHDRKTLEDYSLIAKSMDSTGDFIHAVQLKIKADPKSEPGTFLDIADSWESLGIDAAVEKTLHEGMELFPRSATILLRLADHLIKRGHEGEAFGLLTNSTLVSDKRVSSRIISLGAELGLTSETLRLVRNLTEEWSIDENLDLAGLYESAGESVTALSHYKKAGEAGAVDVARVEADLAFQRGDVASAVRLQAKYLSITKEPDFEGWTFMGDLHKIMGNSAAAKIAYNKALKELKRKMIGPPAVAQTR